MARCGCFFCPVFCCPVFCVPMKLDVIWPSPVAQAASWRWMLVSLASCGERRMLGVVENDWVVERLRLEVDFPMRE